MGALDWLDEELAKLDDAGLRRRRPPAIRHAAPVVQLAGRDVLNLCSNDYLSLASRVVTDCGGAGASRLVAGELSIHGELEGALAGWLGVEQTLLYSSGYAANVGIIAALASPDSLIVSDERNHASIVDGCRLSRARVVVTRHCDVGSVRAALTGAPERRKMVITEGYFSMDATRPRLADLASECRARGAALYVDEAHGLGVWGDEGRGVAQEMGVRPDVLVGTLGKSFGSAGAFVAGSRSLVDWLWNRSRSFVFSTGLSPLAARAALEALPTLRAGERRIRLHAHAEAMRARLTAPGEGPILPLVIGDPRRAVALAQHLLERGILLQAIRPPTVSRDTSRLRLTVQSGHSSNALADAAAEIARILT